LLQTNGKNILQNVKSLTEITRYMMFSQLRSNFFFQNVLLIQLSNSLRNLQKKTRTSSPLVWMSLSGPANQFKASNLNSYKVYEHLIPAFSFTLQLGASSKLNRHIQG